METRAPLVRCPALVLSATDDPHAYPAAPRVAQAIAGSQRVDIPGGMVPLPDQMPAPFAAAVENFLDGIALTP
jgi:pimeloyl-ACP methyl ester carboxylesterase